MSETQKLMMIRDRAIVTFCLVMNEVLGMEPIGCWEWNQLVLGMEPIGYWEWNQLATGNGTNWVLGMEPIGYWEWNQLGPGTDPI